MNPELQKNSIRSLLQEKGELTASGRVRSESLSEEMSLIGFIPYSYYSRFTLLSLKADLNDQLIVSPYFVRFSKQDSVLPIFRTIRSAKGKKYLIDEKLTIDSVPETVLSKATGKYVYEFRNELTQPLLGRKLVELRKKLTFKRKGSFEQLFDGYIEKIEFEKDSIEENELDIQYIAQNDDWELSGHVAHMITITNDFLCLCSYMNKITGLPSYTVLCADDIIRVLSDHE